MISTPSVTYFRRFKWILLLLVILQLDVTQGLTSKALYNEMTLDTYSVNNVTIFSSSSIAEVTRTYPIDSNLVNTLSENEDFVTLVASSLPISLDESSLHLTSFMIDDKSNIQIVGTAIVDKTVYRYGNSLYYKYNSTLQDDLGVALKSLNEIQYNISRLEARLQIIYSMATNSNAIKSNEVYDSFSSFLKAVDKETLKTSDALIAETERSNVVKTQINLINNAIQKLKREGIFDYNGTCHYFPASKKTKEFHIYAKVKSSGKSATGWSLSLAYMLSPASWEPDYDIKVASQASIANKYKLSIGYYARVSKDINEDWDDIRLTLSSSQPQYINEAPKPIKNSIGIGPVTNPTVLLTKMSSRGYQVDAMMKADAPEFTERVSSAMMDAQQTGDLSLSFEFVIPYPVTLVTNNPVAPDMIHQATSNIPIANPAVSNNPANNIGDDGYEDNRIVIQDGDVSSSYRTNECVVKYKDRKSIKYRLLLNHIHIDAQLYVYAIPSQNNGRNYLRAWGKYHLPAASSYLPILQSNNARITLQGSYIGTKSIPQILPDESFFFDLGEDSNVKVKHTKILSMNGGIEEDKSTWFTADKKEFAVRTRESFLSAKNLLSDAMKLVILTENLPKSTHEDISIKLKSPSSTEIASISTIAEASSSDSKDSSSTVKYLSDENYIEEILKYYGRLFQKLQNAMATDKKISETVFDDYYNNFFKKPLIFLNPTTNNIFWTKYLMPSEEYQAQFKYDIIWPKEKAINMVASYE